MEDRIHRALTQRIFLIDKLILKDGSCDLHVAGLTDQYHVHISLLGDGHHSCTCPDHVLRNRCCKHIFFSLFRVGKVDKESWIKDPSLVPVWSGHDSGPTYDEETEADTKKRKRIEKEDEDCSICYEAFVGTLTEPFTYCESCGHRFHSQCMNIWLQRSPQSSCPMCRSKVTLVKRLKMESEEKFTLFFSGPFSNWAQSPFTIDERQFTCVEQYMMFSKAMLFHDVKIAEAIMQTHNPKEMKRLGRLVKNFCETKWADQREDIVKKGLVAKFTQNPELKDKLLNTKGTTLAEASAYDQIWGIGLSIKNPDAQKRDLWKGQNLLGKLLTEIRNEIE